MLLTAHAPGCRLDGLPRSTQSIGDPRDPATARLAKLAAGGMVVDMARFVAKVAQPGHEGHMGIGLLVVLGVLAA